MNEIDQNVVSPQTRRCSDGKLCKLCFYVRKYGLVHAVCAGIGRSAPWFWRLVGRMVTAPFLHRWLKTKQRKILNLGGGSNCLVDCLTADIDPRSDVYLDITEPFPLPGCSVDGIYCEEVIEHLEESVGLAMLKECFRILRPGGVIRLTTPDGDRLVGDHAGLVSREEADDVLHGHGHRYVYTRQRLWDQCCACGFINISQSSYRDRESQLGYLDSHADRFSHDPDLSQYLEAEKPDEDIRAV